MIPALNQIIKTLNHFKDNTLRKNDEYIYVSKNNKVIKYFKTNQKSKE